MSLRLGGRAVVFDGSAIEADDVFCEDADIGLGMVHRIRKVGFFRGVYEVAVLWSTGSYSSNATGLGAAMHGRQAGEFTEEPDEVEVAVGRDGDLLPLDGHYGDSLSLRFVPVDQVPRILDYIAALPADASSWEWPERESQQG